MKKPILWRTALILSTVMALVACDNDDNNTAQAPAPTIIEFDVEVVNLTASQPFSPVALIAHDSNYRLFMVGSPATMGLEILAEGGDNTELLNEANANNGVVMSLSGSGPLPPGAMQSSRLMIPENQLDGLLLTGVTMLVNTNDAFTAASNVSLSDLAVSESKMLTTISYDSGTEANTEGSGTMPGPADGGEGFNAIRDDIADEVRMHGGVVTSSDGLTTSRLLEVHRWDNPVARVRITRLN